MRTLSEENKYIRQKRIKSIEDRCDMCDGDKVKKAKVLCDECETQMHYHGYVMATYPAKISVHCPKCGEQGTLTIR